jgi:hypothetical protein
MTGLGHEGGDGLARLCSGRALALGFKPSAGGGPLVMRVLRGWCLGCAVSRSLWSGPRPGCACAAEVERREALAEARPKAEADRLRLGWCPRHAAAPGERGRKAKRPTDCAACMAGLPDWAALTAEAEAVGFFERYAIEPPAWSELPRRVQRDAAAAAAPVFSGRVELRGFALLDGLGFPVVAWPGVGRDLAEGLAEVWCDLAGRVRAALPRLRDAGDGAGLALAEVVELLRGRARASEVEAEAVELWREVLVAGLGLRPTDASAMAARELAALPPACFAGWGLRELLALPLGALARPYAAEVLDMLSGGLARDLWAEAEREGACWVVPAARAAPAAVRREAEDRRNAAVAEACSVERAALLALAEGRLAEAARARASSSSELAGGASREVELLRRFLEGLRPPAARPGAALPALPGFALGAELPRLPRPALPAGQAGAARRVSGALSRAVGRTFGGGGMPPRPRNPRRWS